MKMMANQNRGSLKKIDTKVINKSDDFLLDAFKELNASIIQQTEILKELSNKFDVLNENVGNIKFDYQKLEEIVVQSISNVIPKIGVDNRSENSFRSEPIQQSTNAVQRKPIVNTIKSTNNKSTTGNHLDPKDAARILKEKLANNTANMSAKPVLTDKGGFMPRQVKNSSHPIIGSKFIAEEPQWLGPDAKET